MAEKLPTVPDLSLPYNLNQGEARVNKKDHHRKVKGKAPITKDNRTFVVGIGESVGRVGWWFLKGWLSF